MSKRAPFAVAVVVLVVGTLGTAFSRSTSEPSINFQLNCAGCHQPDGSGLANGSVPTFRSNLGYFLRSPEGREYLVQVPGSSQSPLRDDELAEVLNWVLLQFCRDELPSSFEPYTTEEVRRVRAVSLPDVKASRARIIARLRNAGYDIS